MKNKQLHRFCISIPDYIWRQIMDLDNEMPTTTTTGTILTILEKGLNYYKKKKRLSSLQEESQSTDESLNSTADRKYNNALGITYASPADEEEIKRTLEIAKTRWVEN